MTQAQQSLFGKGPVAAMQPVLPLSAKRKPALPRSLEERRQIRTDRIADADQHGFLDVFERDTLGVTVSELLSRVTKYASGVLSPAYWHAFRAAQRPICVAATELGERSLSRVLTHVANGGTLFVDSGAFVHKDDHAGMPWALVIDIYRQIALSASDDATLTFVLPDAVGCQQGSLDALKTWGNQVIEAVGPSHAVLLPVQRGEMTPSDLINRAMALLDYPIHGLGIPCKAKAFPVEMLADLVNVDRPDVPRRVHFLGLSKDRAKLEKYVVGLHQAWPNATMSCDAVEHRSLVGQGEKITELRHEILKGPITDAVRNTHDEAEADPEIVALADQAMARKFGVDPSDTDTLQSLSCSSAWVAEYFRILDQRAEKRYGAWATAMATYSVIMNTEPRILTAYWQQLDHITNE